jgi:Oxidoreductase molybdopterin binding domain
MKRNACAFILVLFAAFGVFAQAGAKPEPVLRIEAEGGSKLEMKTADLSKLPRRDVKGRDHDEKEHTFSGFELREVLLKAGVKFGNDLRGKKLALYLLVEAADGYHAVFALPELDNVFTDKVVILADTMDGKPLDAKTGPWQIIVPDEKKHGRWVRQVTKLTVKTAI